MLNLKIVTPEKIIFNGNVENVTVPGTLGSFEVLNDHAPIISSLEQGVVEYTENSGRKHLDIKSGFIEVKNNEVNLCVEV